MFQIAQILITTIIFIVKFQSPEIFLSGIICGVQFLFLISNGF